MFRRSGCRFAVKNVRQPNNSRACSDSKGTGQALDSVRRYIGRPYLASMALFILFVAVWHLLTATGSADMSAVDPEYAKLAGQSAAAQPSAAIPTPGAVARRGGELLLHAFDRSNPN